MKDLIESFNNVENNVWAFCLFVLAGATAVVGHFGHDDKLFGFAGTVAGMGATLFQHSKGNSQ